ncbi:MAG: PAS domain-containing protein [Pseudomonadota bacterium]
MTDENAHGTSQGTMVEFKSAGRFEGIAALEAYWQGVRGNRTVPLRSEIDPRGIESALDFAFIVERVTAGVVRFRLAGSQINEMMGMDVRGMPITSLFGSNSRAELLEAIDSVFEGPTIIEVALESPEGAGKPALPAQMILLPLKSDLGDISRAIGCFPTRGAMGRAPRRFEIAGSVKRTPLASDAAPEIRRRPAPQPRPVNPVSGFAEEATGFEGKPQRSPSERPYLKLVRDDDE